jgi:hypothetical protein
MRILYIYYIYTIFELEVIDYKKAIAKHQLHDMNNQITYLNKISYTKRNEIAYLQIGAQELEGFSSCSWT